MAEAGRAEPSGAERGGPASLARLLAVFDLFEAGPATLEAEEITAGLGCSRPTAYRVLKALVDAGFLQRLAGGRYALGSRIVLLDHLIRTRDPLLAAAIPTMRALVESTGCDCVLSGIYGAVILDVHREHGRDPLRLDYGRGRPRPLFRGAAPKAILSLLPVTRLHRLYDAAAAEAVEAGLGLDWPAVRAAFAAIRRRGYYISHGELEPGLSAVAAPLTMTEESVAALALVTSTARFAVLDVERLAAVVTSAARQVQAAASGEESAPPPP